MAEYLAPGVYVEEFDSGPKAMEGVSTSTAGFVGRCIRGKTSGKPSLVTSFSAFTQQFGSYLPINAKDRYLAYAVEQFFANGGSSCYIVRVVNATDAVAKYKNDEDEKKATFLLEASSVGTWGNGIHIQSEVVEGFKSKATKAITANETEINVANALGFKVNDYIEINDGTQSERCKIIEINDCLIKIDNKEHKIKNAYDFKDEENSKTIIVRVIDYRIIISNEQEEEVFTISFNQDKDEYFDKQLQSSRFIKLHHTLKFDTFDGYETLNTLLDDPSMLIFSGGTTNDVDTAAYKGVDQGPGKRTGIQALLELNDVSIVAVPGVSDSVVQQELVNQCEIKKDRFAILDFPKNIVEIDALQEHRGYFDSTFAAIYHPWLLQFDSQKKTNDLFPPSGSIAGIYAKVDTTRGVFKAPANEIVANTMGLGVAYNDAEQGKLNPKGINIIRAIPGAGIRVWGARTCSSDGNWKYINVRRLFIFIEQSIYANTNWAVFEPNDETLWTRVSGTIQMFLNTQWRNGALMGTTPEEAYYIKIGKGITMSDDDILNGRMICEIGISPVRPSEFVIFRITQNTASGE